MLCAEAQLHRVTTLANATLIHLQCINKCIYLYKFLQRKVRKKKYECKRTHQALCHRFNTLPPTICGSPRLTYNRTSFSQLPSSKITSGIDFLQINQQAQIQLSKSKRENERMSVQGIQNNFIKNQILMTFFFLNILYGYSIISNSNNNRIIYSGVLPVEGGCNYK